MKKLSALFLSIFVFLMIPLAVFAQEKVLDCTDPANASLPTCAASSLGISNVLATVIQFIFVVAVVLALGFLVYGGVKWITSGGDKGGVEGARNMIIAAIIGLIVVFLAYVILNLVLQFLTGKGLDQVSIPTISGCRVSAAGADGVVTACEKTNPNGDYACEIINNRCVVAQ